MSSSNEDEKLDFREEETAVVSKDPDDLVKLNTEIELPSVWGQTSKGIQQVHQSLLMLNTKHGMFANVPMVCKGKQCSLHKVCIIAVKDRPKGKRCPVEIAAIVDRYDKYCKELKIADDDYFDQSQVKDVVDIEVKLMRANGLLAISGNFIEEVTAGIGENGDEFKRPELHMATVYEEKLLSRKARILNDLNTTRKSKQQKNTSETSSWASSLMQKAMQAQRSSGFFVDAEYESVEDENQGSGEDHVERDPSSN